MTSTTIRLGSAVKDVLNPRTNYGLLLEQLATCSKINNNPKHESGRSDGASLWDEDSLRFNYLSTIDSKTNERIDMKELLLSTENERTGKLTILDNCTVISVEFEEIERTSSAVSSPSPLPSPSMPHSQNAKESAKIKAISVKYILNSDGKEEKFIQPVGGGEIILCAGVFESPRILLSSGLGKVGESEKVGESGTCIPLVLPVTLLGIGKNLKDHTILPIMCVGKWWPGKVFEPTYSNLLTLLYGILMILIVRYLSKKGDLLSSLIFAGLIMLGTVYFRKVNTRSNDNLNKEKSGDMIDEPFPLNCVHGYVNLDGEGIILARDSKDPPR
jgi:hypothetical protein